MAGFKFWGAQPPEPDGALGRDYRKLIERRISRLDEILTSDHDPTVKYVGPAATIAERTRRAEAAIKTIERKYVGDEEPPIPIHIDLAFGGQTLLSKKDGREWTRLTRLVELLNQEDPSLDPRAELGRLRLELVNDQLARGATLEAVVGADQARRNR